jgi:hypothetical protein
MHSSVVVQFAFKLVYLDWPQVHRTLNEDVPRLFQVWASKQVMNLAATNKNLCQRHRDGWSNKCPCCTIHVETAEHVILCPEEGRVEVFIQSLLFLERWLHKVDTDPELANCIVEYVCVCVCVRLRLQGGLL